MNQMNIKAVNKAIFLSIAFVIVFILAMFGLTYAFFSIVVSGNEEASSILFDAINLGTVTFVDGEEINVSGIYPMEPGERLSKTFTIKSQNNEADIGYVIYLTVSQNEFIQNYTKEFSYTLNGISNAGGTAATGIDAAVPAASLTPYQIGTGLLKAGGDIHTYTFTIGLNEVGSNQNYNQNKSFSGRLHVGTKKYTNQGSIWGD